MAVKIVHDVLVASGAVTAIVGASPNERISPLIKAQNITLPAVTLSRVALTPQNHLRGYGNLESDRVQADSWADTYLQALTLAAACRTAMVAAGHVFNSEFDNHEPEVDEGIYRITQDYTVWI